jgi:hypothetical protein
MFSIRLNAPMPKPLASWGIALESLRKSSGLSQLELTHRKVITPGEYCGHARKNAISTFA